MLEYHPSTSRDSLLKNESVTRCNFYNFAGYPTSWLNGKETTVSLSAINTVYSQKPQLDIGITFNSLSTVPPYRAQITVKVKPLAALSGTFKVFCAITEDSVDYQKVYKVATVNGQKIFNHLVRSMLPNGNGTDLSGVTVNQEKQFTFTYTNDDKHQNYLKTRVVAFVQNTATKDILNAVISPSSPFVTAVSSVNHSGASKARILIRSSQAGIILSSTGSDLCSVTLFGVSGREIFSGRNLSPGMNGIRLPVGKLSAGVYTAKSSDNRQTLVQKVLVE